MSAPRDGEHGRSLLVVHGHRDGNAVGGRAEISSEAVARVRLAERVAYENRIAPVLFCGAGAPGQPSEARQMAACWRGPVIDVLLDERSTDSAENAAEALRWARELGARELIVVSSWWHLRLPAYYLGAAGWPSATRAAGAGIAPCAGSRTSCATCLE